MTGKLFFVFGALLLVASVIADSSESEDYKLYDDQADYDDVSDNFSEFDSTEDENEKALVGDVKFKIPEEYGKQLLALFEDSEGPSPGITARVNNYTDKVLDNIKRIMIRYGLDPMEVPNLHSGFKKRIIFITYTGSIDLTNGWLTDVSTIKRHEDALLTYTPSTKKLRIEVPISFDDLKFNSKYSAKFMGLGPVGGVEANVRNIGMNVVLTIDFKTYEASVENFRITNSGFININFTGHILVDWIVNLFTDVTSLLLHPVILRLTSSTVQSGLNSGIKEFNEFIQNFLNSTETSSKH